LSIRKNAKCFDAGPYEKKAEGGQHTGLYTKQEDQPGRGEKKKKKKLHLQKVRVKEAGNWRARKRFAKKEGKCQLKRGVSIRTHGERESAYRHYHHQSS